jgi:hypothetical protein
MSLATSWRGRHRVLGVGDWRIGERPAVDLSKNRVSREPLMAKSGGT